MGVSCLVVRRAAPGVADDLWIVDALKEMRVCGDTIVVVVVSCRIADATIATMSALTMTFEWSSVS